MDKEQNKIKPFTEEWIRLQNKGLIKRFLIGIMLSVIVFTLLMINGPGVYRQLLSSMGILTRSEAADLLYDFEERYVGQFVFDYKDYDGLHNHFLKARSMTYHAFYEYIDAIAVMANDYASSFIFNTPEVKYYDNYLAKLEGGVPVIETKVLNDQPVGYIQLRSLSAEANDQIALALEKFKQSGVKSLILDMTDSPLGTTEEIVRFLDFFVSNDEIMRYQSTEGYYTVFQAQVGAFQFDKFYILINEDVSGPGEIIAASLKNHLKETVDLIGGQPYGVPFLFEYKIDRDHQYVFKFAISEWQVGRKKADEIQWVFSETLTEYSLENALEWIKMDLIQT